MITVRPAMATDPVVMYAKHYFLAVYFQFIQAGGKGPVYPGLREWFMDYHYHGGIPAGRIIRSVILGLYRHPVLPNRKKGFFPGFRKSLTFYLEYGNITAVEFDFLDIAFVWHLAAFQFHGWKIFL
jgi:hypothetical protein